MMLHVVFSMHVVVNLGSQQWANLREKEGGRERERERERKREPVRRSGGEGESRQGEG